ncbi:MAG: electron transport complex subunit RsxA [Spirochaetes bacterium]|nr:electron transport complex subunit RsxA [Spirochaetota bacterium]
MEHYFIIIVSAALVNNFVLSRFLGLCPFIGVSKKMDSALGMGMAVIFVLTLASIITYLLNKYLLIPNNIVFLRTVTFILVIATLVQLVEMFIQKVSPPLYQALGIYLPLITTNCAVLGAALINIKEDFNLLESAINGVGAGIGFTLALFIMSGIRERLELANIPKSFKGAPIAFITAGLLSLIFLCFKGILGE